MELKPSVKNSWTFTGGDENPINGFTNVPIVAGTSETKSIT